MTARAELATICGSMRLYSEMLSLAADLTAMGKIVLMPHVIKGQNGGDDGEKLDLLHREKIRISDRVMVVTDDSGYIGESTSSEIEYASAVGIPVQIVSMSKGNTGKE